MKSFNHLILKYAVSSFAGVFLLLIFMTAMKHSSETDRSYSYLALGDSYTIGEMVPVAENFPNQLRYILSSRNIRFNQPKIVAETGWTTDELHAAIRQAKLRKKYDFVTLLIGVNNQYRGLDISNYSIEFEVLLQQAIAFAGNRSNHVTVLSIPDWGATPFASGRNRQQISNEIDHFNSANREISNRYRVNYVDITPGTRESFSDRTLVAADGLHPSPKEYAIWAGKLAAIIEEVIREKE
jgi:lysophospholipase L1-like esterase